MPDIQSVKIPKIEDEIEEAWRNYQRTASGTARALFEAGFRAGRTFMIADKKETNSGV
jgi:hypothetical protein